MTMCCAAKKSPSSPGSQIHIPTIHIHSIATWWCTTTRNVARLDDKPRARGSKRVKTEQNKPSCSKSKQSSNAFHNMQQAGRTGTRNSARSNTDTRWYSDTQTRSSSRSGLRVAAPRRNENSFLSRISIVSRFACAADTDTVHISCIRSIRRVTRVVVPGNGLSGAAMDSDSSE